MDTQMISNPEKLWFLSVDNAKRILPITSIVLFLLSASILTLMVIYRPAPLSSLEKEASQAKKKHKDLIIDVRGLPRMEGAELTIISINSLDDLISTAEALFKPVLHKPERERHTYCVIDGMIKYKFVSTLFPPGVEEIGTGAAPHILRTLPIDKQTDVPINQPIQLVFGQPMEPASVESSLVISPSIRYTIRWLEGNTVLLVVPVLPWRTGTTYNVQINTGASSADGLNLEESYSFSFTTSLS
jgi:hypothetical protein